MELNFTFYWDSVVTKYGDHIHPGVIHKVNAEQLHMVLLSLHCWSVEEICLKMF